MAQGDVCKIAGCTNIVTSTRKICNSCHNYPERRRDKHINLHDKFLGLTKEKKHDSTT